MSILKKPETYIGAAAVALVACLANCPNTDDTPSPIPEAKELKSRRTITRQDIEDIIRDFGVKEDESEFSVHVPLDENGEIPENFDYVGAVRDCVESTGLYRCINRRSMPMSVCHSIDEDNPVSPVSLARNLNDDVVVGYSIFGMTAEAEIFELNDAEDPEFVKGQLNQSCEKSIELLEKNIPLDELCGWVCTPGDDESEKEKMLMLPMLDELSNDLFAEAEEAGIEAEDKGGAVTILKLEEWSTIVYPYMAFGYDDEERAWVYTPAISIEKPSGFPKTFFSSEEAIDYLIQTDPNQKIEEE